MSDFAISFDPAMRGLDDDQWIDRLIQIADDFGHYEPLGDDHLAVFIDAGPKLLVTFEDIQAVRQNNPKAEPRGFQFVRRSGWSHLALFSSGESWFRDPTVYEYFDRMTDEGFFDDFDDVLFYGVHAGGYAAAAYSVTSPGATVLAIRPQATLNPRITGFDRRYVHHRRLNFVTRYGYAPDMIDAAGDVFIAFDPNQRFDAIHAALFTKPNVTQLRCTGMGANLDAVFDAMDVHEDLIRSAMDRRLDTEAFADLLQGRFDYTPYLRNLINRAVQAGHPKLAASACKFVLQDGPDPYFERKLGDLLAREGSDTGNPQPG